MSFAQQNTNQTRPALFSTLKPTHHLSCPTLSGTILHTIFKEPRVVPCMLTGRLIYTQVIDIAKTEYVTNDRQDPV